MTEPLLRVRAVSHTYRDRNRQTVALADISFGVAPGEFVCIVGTSGSGKSTLLRILGGLLRPDSGRVFFAGQPVESPQPAIGFVFQNTNLMPWRTALQNVLLPLELRGRTGPDATRQAQEALALVGLEAFADAYPAQLSGGMAQRLTLARTLLQRPGLLLLDEPFGALDALTREHLNQELLRIRQAQQQTVVMITHSIQEAVFLADWVLVLGGRPGKTQGTIPVNLPRPRSLGMLAWPQAGRLIQAIRQCIGANDRPAQARDPKA